MKLNLQYFDDPSYTVTCLADSGFSAFSASPASGAKNTDVTLTVTLASGKELDEIEVCAGGVTVTETSGTYSLKIGEANITLYAKSKSNKRYKVVENRMVCVNGTKTQLTRNMTLVVGNSGAVVDVSCTGTDLNISADVIAELVKEGVLVKM